MKYAALFERTDTGYSAYLPDFDGCVSTGATLEEAVANLTEALDMHLVGMIEDGTPIPEPVHVAFIDAKRAAAV